MSRNTFAADVTAIDRLSDEVSSFTFQAVDGTPFQAAQAGDHVDVALPGGFLRQYSLWRWDQAGNWGSVAVKREDAGRGGSLAMHALVPGKRVMLTGPRTNFPLEETAPHSILLAGGIGATPIHAMAARLKALGKSVEVHYLVRSARHAAFQPAFEALGLGSALSCRYDDRDGLIDLAALLDGAPGGSHFYVCGPEPLLNAALAAAAPRLPSAQVHFERFAADPAASDGPSDAFEVVLSRSGLHVTVAAEKSILDALLEAGVSADYGCTAGVCGACIVDVLEGEIDHRDSVLTPDEQSENSMMCLCVSRAKGGRLVLDL